ncbi:hypothetical protein LJC38_00045 [Parabacteroides sp. OttesenSCG-928-K15]|nr:hypothetical protein [Parabacteroides sp. OttesenSCG-928-K15]
MKRILFIALLFSVLASYVYSQKKMYIYKPSVNEYISTDLLEGQKIKLTIKDTRVIAPKSKIEASFEDIKTEITKALYNTYPKATFSESESNVEIIINVKSYDVTFYTGMWHAQTRYVVTIKHGEKEVEDDLEQINRFYNTTGTKKAKTTLNKCFNNANLQRL